MSGNIINKIVFEVDLFHNSSSDNALPQSESYYNYYVLPTIHKVIDDYEKQNIYINKRVVIDLGNVDPQDIPQKLEKQLNEVLKQYILDENHKFRAGELTSSTVDLFRKENLLPGSENNLIFVEEFFNYLNSPIVPWHVAEKESFDIETITNKALKIIEENESFLQQLFKVISRDNNTYSRFIYLLTESDSFVILEKLIKLAISRHTRGIQEYNEQLWSILTHKTGNKTRKEFYSKILKYFLFDCSYSISENKKYLEFLQEIEKVIGYELEDIEFFKSLAKIDLAEKTVEEKNISENRTNSLDNTTLNNDRINPIHDRSLTNSSKDKNNQVFKIEGNHLFFKVEDSYENINRIPIDNAGLIILHPFLPLLFQNLRFLDNNNMFISLEKQIRAVHLLQRMTGTSGKHFDHLLPLCKILCGMEPFFPISPIFRITQKEKTEALELLNSAINYWSVLKNTSVGGFQEAFIRRNGLLEKSENDWILRVESKGVDVLLEDIPWDIYLAKLAWNKYLIFTEWKYN